MVQKFRPETLYIKKSVLEHILKIPCRNLMVQKFCTKTLSTKKFHVAGCYTENFYTRGCNTGTFYVGRFISEVFIPKISVLQVPVQGLFCAKNKTNSTQQKRSVIRPLLFVGMKENKQKGNSNDIDSYHLSFNRNTARFSAWQADWKAGPGAVFETRFAVLRQKRGCSPTTADNGD